MANEYVNKVSLADGTTLIDLSNDTVMAADVLSGATFHLASGQQVTGTLSTSSAAQIGTGEITTTKLADGAVTYEKMADSAKFSPIVLLTTSITLATNHLGKTLVTNNNSVNFVITVPNSSNLAIGYEVAILNCFSTSTTISFANNVNTLIYGNDDAITASQFVVGKNSMVALKKITSNLWLLTGIVSKVAAEAAL